jgi:hypothetical protein
MLFSAQFDPLSEPRVCGELIVARRDATTLRQIAPGSSGSQDLAEISGIVVDLPDSDIGRPTIVAFIPARHAAPRRNPASAHIHTRELVSRRSDWRYRNPP